MKKRTITNCELARLAVARGCESSFSEVLESLDIGRTVEQEEQELFTESEIDEMVDSLILSYLIKNEENGN